MHVEVIGHAGTRGAPLIEADIVSVRMIGATERPDGRPDEAHELTQLVRGRFLEGSRRGG